MKTTSLFLLVLTYGLLTAQTTIPGSYCAGNHTVYGNYITNVTLGSFTNTTNASSSTGYYFYNNLPAINLQQLSNKIITISGLNSISSMHFVAVYIDYNQNNLFTDSGELAGFVTINPVGGPIVSLSGPQTFNFTVPGSAVIGNTRMRVIIFENDEYTLTNNNHTPISCTTILNASLRYKSGETEDYTVNITANLGINNIEKSNFIVGPVPTNDNLFINQETKKTCQYEIYSVSGILVTKGSLNDLSNKIDVSDLQSSIYILKIVDDEKSINLFKFIKN